MSYDFLMMKPKVEIRSQDDLSEETLFEQEPTVLVAALSAMFPELDWSPRGGDGGWSGRLDGDDTWYEFLIAATPDYVWSIRTSHLTRRRGLIQPICAALGLIAFDGQAMVIIGPDGARPADGGPA
jgi:hypothetical protein